MDPEAGSLKTSGSERIIPLHPALIESVFLKFVSTIKSGPLFADLSPDKFGKRGGKALAPKTEAPKYYDLLTRWAGVDVSEFWPDFRFGSKAVVETM